MALALGTPFFLGAVGYKWGRLNRWSRLGVALICLSIMIFPIFWLYGSWRYLGHPFQFVRNQMQFSVNHPNAIDFNSTLWYHGIIYPKEIMKQTGLLWPLTFPLLALILWKNRGWRVALSLIIMTLLLTLFLIITAINSGYGNTPFRTPILIYLLLLCLFSMGMGIFPCPLTSRQFTSWRNRWILSLLGLMLVGWFGYNGLMGNRVEEKVAEDIPHDIITLGAWLQQEVKHPQMLPHFGVKTRIGIIAPKYQAEWSFYLAYAAGCPERISSVPTDTATGNILGQYDYLIILEQSPPSGWEALASFGRWKVLKPKTT